VLKEAQALLGVPIDIVAAGPWKTVVRERQELV